MPDGRVYKVAVLLPSMQVGGAERLVLEELAYLKNDPRFSFEVHLVFEKGPFFDAITSLAVPVHVWNAPHNSIRMLKTYLDILGHLRRSRCDILHSHLLNSIGPIVGKLAGARVIATVHSDIRYGVIERFVLRRSDLVLGCGNKVLKNIREFIPTRKVAILNNAVREPNKILFQREDLFKRFGIKGGSKLVVSLGRLTRLKGFDVLIEAFRKAVEYVPNAVLLIGGDGDEKKRLCDQVKSAGLGEQVRLPGLVSNVDEVLTLCDLYVNSSRWEGLPMTLLEAMAHGKSIVATRVGGNPEVVHDGVTGMLVPPEDPDTLARAIVRMLKDEDFRVKANEAAFELYKREYSIDRHCDALARYYFQVLQDKLFPLGSTA